MSGTTTPVLMDENMIQDPYSFFRQLRTESPIREAVMPRGLKVWLVTRYADAREALASPALHKDMRQAHELFERHGTTEDARVLFGQDLIAHMLNSDPPDHTRLRNLVVKTFTMRRVEQLRPRVEEITEHLLSNLATQDRVDLVDEYAFPLPVTVICELLGIPDDNRDDFRSWSTTLVSAGDVNDVTAASQAMAAFLNELIATKRANPADDLLSALIQARDDGEGLTEVELVSMAFLLLVAGHETTVNLIANGVLALLNNPDQLTALRANPALLPGAVEEFLRYDSPVNHATMRYTTEPLDLAGTTIPAGEFVVISLSSANRDDARFPNADTLDVTRPAGGHLAFGHGIHFCVGAQLARLEGQLAIGHLLDRFPNLTLDTNPANLRWRNTTLLRGLESLPVRLH